MRINTNSNITDFRGNPLDNTVTSEPVLIDNTPPVANAGEDRTAPLNRIITLDASSKSDRYHNTLSFAWRFTERPPASAAQLRNATTSSPSFIPDVLGDYELQLIVNDGIFNSVPDTMSITAVEIAGEGEGEGPPPTELSPSPPILLNPNAAPDAREDRTPDIAADGFDHWIAVWSSQENLRGAGTDSDIFFTKSTDNATTCTELGLLNINASFNTRSDNTPQIATGSNGKWVVIWEAYIPWQDAYPSKDGDIFVATSTDNGDSWSAPQELNPWEHTYFDPPQLATDAVGNWVVVWRAASLESHYESSGLQRGVYMARSTDNANTWSNQSRCTPPTALATFPFTIRS